MEMAAMVVTAATGALSSLLSKLSDLLTDQYKQRKGVRRDIEFLRCELTDMNAALETLADMEKLDAQTKVWRDNVREMAYDIEDSIDVFMLKLGQEDDDDNDGLFRRIVGKARELRLHYQFADKIQELRARVQEQSQSRERYSTGSTMDLSQSLEWCKSIQGCLRCLRMQGGLWALMIHKRK